MADDSLRRALLLLLLGMGTFFLIAALLAALVWLTVGNWRTFLVEIALASTLAVIPVASFLWGRYVVERL